MAKSPWGPRVTPPHFNIIFLSLSLQFLEEVNVHSDEVESDEVESCGEMEDCEDTRDLTSKKVISCSHTHTPPFRKMLHYIVYQLLQMCEVYMEEAMAFVIDLLKTTSDECSTDDSCSRRPSPLTTIFKFCEELSLKALTMPLSEVYSYHNYTCRTNALFCSFMQVLTFMTTASLDGEPAIGIYLTKASTFTSFTVQTINKAVRVSAGLGKTQDKRAYLKSGCTDPVRQSGYL